MFDIKITGLDDILKSLEKMQYGLSLEGINSYCEQIKKAATNCGIARDELELEATRSVDDVISIKCSLQDRGKKECLIKAINEIMPSMPITLRPLFENLLSQLNDTE